ncbi:MAG: S-layer homology domain-containing protein [Thermoleophilia bacterium]|nr:S-layer homology domain-containing protein [Thermoleophilia bacterium]
MGLRSVVRAFSDISSRRRLLIDLGAGVLIVVALMASVATLASADPAFPDVPSTHPYEEAIADLASRGIISGYQNGDFGPGDPVTRQQYAKMIVLAGGYPVSEGDVCPFADVAKGGADTFFPDNYIAVCAVKGITTGVSPAIFSPSGKITRHQVTTMVVRAADDLQPGLLAVAPGGWTANSAWANDSTHGANAVRAEYNGLLAGLDLSALNPAGNMSRGEVAQVLHNLLDKLAPGSTTTTRKPPDQWTQLHPSGAPSARGGHSMVYDSAAKKVVLFGGIDDADDRTTLLNDTWVYDPAANKWIGSRPGGAPPARTYFSMVHDPGAKKTLLFGGQDWSRLLSDSWAYDAASNTWTLLHPAGAPAARGGHSMAYDPGAKKVILFGGSGAAGLLRDTWGYDAASNTWTELHPVGTLPPARRFHSMAYDPGAKKVILFGGSGATGLLRDSWAYDAAAGTWTELHPVGALPPARCFHSMVYDAKDKRVILLGGRASALNGPWDPAHLADVWAYDAASNTWTELHPAGGPPPARLSYPIVYDSAAGKVILFGGYSSDGAGLNDTWVFGPPSYQTATAPPL